MNAGRKAKGDRWVMITGIIAITVLCLAVELETGEPLLTLKLLAMYFIGMICGVKGVSRFIPIRS